ncbi:MAG: WD40 repeat domain-containing protein [Fimbriimonadaceae bacterium]|nr:WD40 repeat domain-containing protein [Fimbriimonadaceae bacterium]QYK57421.1 MAG: WD40 repeat domain-containing protein [Fimbriimonadaceae bacterium]
MNHRVAWRQGLLVLTVGLAAWPAAQTPLDMDVVFEGHRQGILAVDHSEDGRYLATADFDGGVVFREAKSLLPRLRFQTAPNLTHAVLEPNGAAVFTAHGTNTVRKHSAVDGSLVATITVNGIVTGLDMEPSPGFFRKDVLAIATDRGLMSLRDAATGAVLQEFQAPVDLKGVTLGPDAKTVAGGGKDGRLYYAEAESPGLVGSYSVSPNPIADVEFEPNGSTLLVCVGTTVVRLNFFSGQPIATYNLLQTTRTTRFARDGSGFFALGNGLFRVPFTGTRTVLVGGVGGIDVSPDGETLVSVSVSNDVSTWAGRLGTVIRGGVSAAVLLPDGKSAVLALEPNGLVLVDPATLATMRSFPTPGGTQSLAVSGDGRFIARSSPAEGRTEVIITEGWSTVRHLPTTGQAMAFNEDGSLLLIGNTDGLFLFDLPSGQLRWAKPYPQLRQASFSPDGRFVLTASGFGAATLWSLADGSVDWTVSHTLVNVAGVAFGPDGFLVAIAGTGVDPSDSGVRLLDAATFEFQGSVLVRGVPASSVAWSQDGRLLSIARFDRTFAVKEVLGFDTENTDLVGTQALGLVLGKSRVLGFDPALRSVSSTALGLIKGNLQAGSRETATASAFSRNGRLVCFGDTAGVDWLVSSLNGSLVFGTGFQVGRVNGVAFHPDGRHRVIVNDQGLVSVWRARHPAAGYSIGVPAFGPVLGRQGQEVAVTGADGKLRVFETFTGVLRLLVTVSGGSARAVDWNEAAGLIATGGDDGSVTLVDETTGAVVAPLAGHTGAVRGVAFSSNGKILTSVAEDGTVRTWDVAGRRLLANRALGSPGTALAVSPDGSLVAVGLSDGRVRFLRPGGLDLLGVRAAPGRVTHLAFSPDSRRIAVCTEGGGGVARVPRLTTLAPGAGDSARRD